MENGDPRLEPLAKKSLHLSSKSDLRHQNQTLTSQAQGFSRGRQIHFCLTAAGYSVKQKTGEAVLLKSMGDGLKCLLLMTGKLAWGRSLNEGWADGVTIDLFQAH